MGYGVWGVYCESVQMKENFYHSEEDVEGLISVLFLGTVYTNYIYMYIHVCLCVILDL